MPMRPVPYSAQDLAAVLRDMADRVERGDSFEGSIEYLMPIEEDKVPVDTYAMVSGGYRIGNTRGQGGYRMLGQIP